MKRQLRWSADSKPSLLTRSRTLLNFCEGSLPPGLLHSGRQVLCAILAPHAVYQGTKRYIYIYIYKERERERSKKKEKRKRQKERGGQVRQTNGAEKNEEEEEEEATTKNNRRQRR